jgi:hypothetical protein
VCIGFAGFGVYEVHLVLCGCLAGVSSAGLGKGLVSRGNHGSNIMWVWHQPPIQDCHRFPPEGKCKSTQFYYNRFDLVYQYFQRVLRERESWIEVFPEAM